jgi:DNA-binding phage protein
MAALRDRLEFEPANPGAKPRYDTVLKLLPALGVDLHATATHARGR